MKRIKELFKEIENYIVRFNNINGKEVQCILNEEDRIITIVYYSMPMYVDIRDICEKYTDLNLSLDKNSSWGYIAIEF